MSSLFRMDFRDAAGVPPWLVATRLERDPDSFKELEPDELVVCARIAGAKRRGRLAGMNVFGWTRGCKALAVFMLRLKVNGAGQDFGFQENSTCLARILAEVIRRPRRGAKAETPEGKNWLHEMFLSRDQPASAITSVFDCDYFPARKKGECSVKPWHLLQDCVIVVYWNEGLISETKRLNRLADMIESQIQKKPGAGGAIPASTGEVVETDKEREVSEMALADAATSVVQSPSVAPTEQKLETAALTAESIRRWTSSLSCEPLRKNPSGFLGLTDQAKEVLLYYGLNRLFHKDFPLAEPCAYPPPSFMDVYAGNMFYVVESALEELNASASGAGLRSRINQANEDLATDPTLRYQVVEAVDRATRTFLEREGRPESAIEEVAPIWNEPFPEGLRTENLHDRSQIERTGTIKGNPRGFLALPDKDKELILYQGIHAAYEDHLRKEPQCACPRSHFIERHKGRAVEFAEIGLKELKRACRPGGSARPGSRESAKDLERTLFGVSPNFREAQEALRSDATLKRQVTELIREACAELACKLLAWRSKHRTRRVADTGEIRSDAG